MTTDRTMPGTSIPDVPTFGPHLMGDLVVKPRQWSGHYIEEFMLEVAYRAGLQPMGKVHTDWYSGQNKGAKTGWDGPSATLHIQTSHITAHFFHAGYVFIDIFSCKDFDQPAVIKYIEVALDYESCDWRTVRRGASFPTRLRKAMP